MASALRKNIYLVGHKEDMKGSKLPSCEDVLGHFLHHHQKRKLTIRNSASAVVDTVKQFWDKARIPMCRKDHAIVKVEKLHQEYQMLKKGMNRRSAPQLEKEESFQRNLKNLFDVAAADALIIMTIQEDKDFLLAQRETGRRGCMGSKDLALYGKEKRATERTEKIKERQKRCADEMFTAAATAQLDSSSKSEASISGTDASAEEGETSKNICENPSKWPKRGTKDVLTPSLAAALDRTKVTDRKATYVIAETARSLGHNVEELNISRSAIRRQRLKHRAQLASSLKQEFQADVPLVVHWDGKLMQTLTRSNEHTERLPILVSGCGVSQLLQVAKLPNGTGIQQAKAVVAALEDWGITVVGMSFDTTASNTGRKNGACVLIEQRLEKDLLYFACRHHIMELIVGAVFHALMGSSQAPEVRLFKRFQERWEFIDKAAYDIGVENDEVNLVICDQKAAQIAWVEKALSELKHQRDDYREFLELVLIFLGGTPPDGIRFLAPGPMHQARWMAKVIYSLKLWMFKGQFKLTSREERGLRGMCIFAATIYAKHWTEAPLPAAAPRNDLELLKALYSYRAVDDMVSKAATSKFLSHLWYLSEELVGLSFFDPAVSSATKAMMAKAITERVGAEEPQKRVTLPLESIQGCRLEDFVTKATLTFFEKLKFPTEFLVEDPDTWMGREDFIKASKIVKDLKVTNDNAERGIALIQEYNRHITHDEEQLQYLLQVVAAHRKKFPQSQKSTLIGPH